MLEPLFGGRPPERFTEKTIAGLAQLRGDLALAREHSYAIDDQERTMGMRCVAAPIMNAQGEVVAGI